MKKSKTIVIEKAARLTAAMVIYAVVIAATTIAWAKPALETSPVIVEEKTSPTPTPSSSPSPNQSLVPSKDSTTTPTPSIHKVFKESTITSSALQTYRVKVTHYCWCAVCNGHYAYSKTASGTTPKTDRTIAHGFLPFGTIVEIRGKRYTVEDRGVHGNHVDVFVDSHQAAWREPYGMYWATMTVIEMGRK